MHQCSIGFILWSVRSWFKTGKAWTGRHGNGGLWRWPITLSTSWDHNYYTKDNIITCDGCISGKFYSFVSWITWWQVTSDEDAWRPLIRYGITGICILWFCGDILSCAYLGIYEIDYFTSFFVGSCVSYAAVKDHLEPPLLKSSPLFTS